MALFSFLKKKAPAAKKEDQSFEEYMRDLRAGRMAENEPVLSRGSVDRAPVMNTKKFHFDDVLIGTVPGGKHYLLDGSNAAAFIHDLDYINGIAESANAEVVGLPSFCLSQFEIAFEPFPFPERQSWQFCRLVIEDLTPTGKQKKYPLSIIVETFTDSKSAKFYYDQDGLIGKGRIRVVNPDKSNGIASYSMDFINGKVSHITASSLAGERFELYNKNHE